jgi:hypothetical protein
MIIDINKTTEILKKLDLSISQIDTITYFILCANRDNYIIHNWYINKEKEVSIVYTVSEENNKKTKYVYSVLICGSYCQSWSDDKNYEYFEKTYKRIQASKEFEIL